MVNRLIALNTKHFADKQKNNRGYAETQTGEQLDELLRQEWLRRDVADIRAGKEGEEGLVAIHLPSLHGFQGQPSCAGLHPARSLHLYDVCGYRQPQAGARGL